MITIEQQVAAVAREIALRKAVYPGRVAAKKMKQEKADHEISAMEAVLETLKVCQHAAELLEEEAKLARESCEGLGGRLWACDDCDRDNCAAKDTHDDLVRTAEALK